MEKITKREMYEAIVEAVESGEWSVPTEAVIAFAKKEIATLDKMKAKKAEKAAEKRAQGDALKDAVKSVLNEDYQIITDISAAIEDEEATVGKIIHRLSVLVKEGFAKKQEVSVVDESGKKRKVMGYALA